MFDLSAAYTNNKGSEGGRRQNGRRQNGRQEGNHRVDGRQEGGSRDGGSRDGTETNGNTTSVRDGGSRDGTETTGNTTSVSGETTSGSSASVVTESSVSSKWSVRGLDETNVTMDNLDKILKGRYENADKHVQELFLFVYCDCALNAMPKVPREDAGVPIKVGDYFKKFPAITCAMIMVLVRQDAEERKKEAEAERARRDQEHADGAPTYPADGMTTDQEDQENQENHGNTRIVNKVPKSKGGRPKDVLNFDKGMQGPWQMYANTEVENRKASEDDEDSDPMTWYEAAVTEMDRKTATRTRVANKETAPPLLPGQTNGQVTNKEKDKYNFAFLKAVNMEEV